MNHIKHFEQLLIINRRLAATGLPVVLNLTYQCKSKFLVLCHLEKDKNMYGLSHNVDKRAWPTMDRIIEEAHKLCQPQFIPVKAICINALGQTFWLDEQTEVIVDSIAADGVHLSDGQVVSTDRLFIKE